MMAISAHAQDVETIFDEDTVAVDSALMDSTAHDSIAAKTIELPWPQSLVATLDDLVKSYISQTKLVLWSTIWMPTRLYTATTNCRPCALPAP